MAFDPISLMIASSLSAAKQAVKQAPSSTMNFDDFTSGKATSYINPVNVAINQSMGASKNLATPTAGQLQQGMSVLGNINPNAAANAMKTLNNANAPLNPSGNANVQSGYQAQPLPAAYNAQAELQKLYAQQRNAQLSALRNRITGQVNAAETQRIGLAPMFQGERSDADAQAMIAGKRLSEIMAQKGLGSSGENVTANVALQNQRQNAFANIGQRETTANAQINAQISNLRQSGEGDIASMEAALAADKTGSLLDELRRQSDIAREDAKYNNQFGYQQYRDSVGDTRYNNDTAYNRFRDSVGDQRYADQTDYSRSRDAVGDTRYEDQTTYSRGQDAKAEKERAEALTWSRSQGNPEYRRSIALAKVAELQAGALPEQQKAELEAAKQKLSTDKTLTEAQIAQIYANIGNINARTYATQNPTPKASTSSSASKTLMDRVEKQYPISAFKDPNTGETNLEARRNAIKDHLAKLGKAGYDPEVVREALMYYGFYTPEMEYTGE